VAILSSPRNAAAGRDSLEADITTQYGGQPENRRQRAARLVACERLEDVICN
jgi:hypothetical protein